MKASALLSKHDVCKHIEIKTDMGEFDRIHFCANLDHDISTNRCF